MTQWYDDYDDFEDEFTLSEREPDPNTLIIEGPIYAQSRRGEIGTEWWGMAWVEALTQLGYDSRMQRGTRYARNGSVLRLEIGHGLVYAEVQGSRYRPYRTAIHLSVLSDDAWDQVLTALSEQALYPAKLLAGEMPPDIETVFQNAGHSLFPRNSLEISFECSCPDWGDPCKHAAAVYYLIAEQLDDDPLLLFHLRGRTREDLLKALQLHDESAPEQETKHVPLTVAGFWDAPQVTPVPLPQKLPKPHALAELGTPPNGLERGLNNMYRKIAKEARRWLGV